MSICSPSGGDAVVGELVVSKYDQLPNRALTTPKLLTQPNDDAGERRRARDRPDHGELATLDALGDHHFAFTVEQGHRSHFAEIHTDRVVGLVNGGGGHRVLGVVAALAPPVDEFLFAILLFRVDDLDTGIPENAEEVVQVL